MQFRYGLCWLLVFWLRATTANEGFKPIVRPLLMSTRTNISVGKSLAFDEEEILAREAGYYQYPLAPPPYLPPVYGPPPEYPEPEGNLEIHFYYDQLTIECEVDRPLEHIIWTKFPCPNQLYFGEGIHVADGAVVYNDNLYDVEISGYNGVYMSRLTIYDPIGDESSGLYRCEAWPHFHSNGNGYGNGYQQYGTYPYYSAVESSVFIIGGDSLLENCYGSKQNYGSFGNKVNQGTTNKKPSNSNMNKTSKPKDNYFKIRRNSTKSSVDRKDANAKYLRYNIKFDNNLIPNRDSRNITLKEFIPSFKFPFQSRHNDAMAPPKGPKSPQLVGNVTSSIRFDFLGNGNSKTWNSKYRSNLKQGEDKNITVESLARKSLYPRNQTDTR